MPILDKWTVDFISNSLDQTIRLGVRLGELLRVHDLLCLSGELGVGKTMLARGIGRGWGTAMRVTSPSYVLVNQYPRFHDNLVLFHIDCYRLEAPGEVATSGIEDVLELNGAFMIEWPERVEPLLPGDRLWIQLGYLNPTRRTLRFSASGERSARLLEDFKHSAFGI